MINHITLLVGDLEKSKNFYSQALKPLGYKLLKEIPEAVGFGVDDREGWRDLWIASGRGKQESYSFSCLAFTASSKEMVDSFFQRGTGCRRQG